MKSTITLTITGLAEALQRLAAKPSPKGDNGSGPITGRRRGRKTARTAFVEAGQKTRKPRRIKP